MKKKVYAAIAVIMILLLLLFLSKDEEVGDVKSLRLESEESAEMSSETIAAEALQEEAGVRADKEPETEPPGSAVCEISLAERALLDQLWVRMEQGDYEGAAKVLNDSEEQLQILFYQTMEAQDWFYDGEQLREVAGDMALSLRRPTALFYGEFQDNYPAGKGVALQAVRVPSGRYDYAEGEWQSGMLEGVGMTGYTYYEESDSEDVAAVMKAGTFHENRMNGSVSYTSTNQDGESSQWILEAADGVTVLDERWNFIESKTEYQLLAEGDDAHVYLLPVELSGEILWRNLLLWE